MGFTADFPDASIARMPSGVAVPSPRGRSFPGLDAAERPFRPLGDDFCRYAHRSPLDRTGSKNTRYLTKVVFMPERNGGYWSDKGYEWYGGT